MECCIIYARIPGNDWTFFNLYDNREKAQGDKLCLMNLGLEVEVKPLEEE